MAESIKFDDLSTSYLSFIPGFTMFKYLVWYGLASNTRKGYNLAKKSFESFCML